MDASVITFRAATLAEIFDLRHAVLRAGKPREAARYPGDDAPSTRHFAAVEGGHVICCLTFLRSEWEGQPAWQLRGMATAPERRRGGIGQKLLLHAEAALRHETPGDSFWCNARSGAVGFYEKLGWRVVSAEFDIAGVGPHVKMEKSPK